LPEITRQPHDVVTYRLHGAVFFGSVARLGTVLDRIAQRPRAVLLDVSDVSFIDSTGARMVQTLGQTLLRRGGELVIVGARPALAQSMRAQGVQAPQVRFAEVAAPGVQAPN
jgi:SulP family sulfate permease